MPIREITKAAAKKETGWRVEVTESMADTPAPEVVQPRLVRLWLLANGCHSGFTVNGTMIAISKKITGHHFTGMKNRE